MNSADRQLFNLGIVITIIAVLGAAMAGGELAEASEAGNGGGGNVANPVFNASTSGTLNEGDSVADSWNPEGKTATVGTFILTWTDEGDATPFHENRGDRFTLTIEAPDGETSDEETETNEPGEQGRIIIVIDFVEEKGYKGDWYTTITLDDAGDQTWFGVGPDPIAGNDDSNEYTLTIEIEWRDD